MDRTLPNPGRRAFLFGANARQAPAAQRPPWTLAEADFVNACTGCGDCLAACPESILIFDDRHLAQVDFARGQGACTFCGACADICAAPAFLPAEERAALPPWPWRASIGDACLTHSGVMCQSCKDACGDGAIRFAYLAGRVAQPVIDLDRCTGCGACQAPCPVAAISFQQREPADVA